MCLIEVLSIDINIYYISIFEYKQYYLYSNQMIIRVVILLFLFILHVYTPVNGELYHIHNITKETTFIYPPIFVLNMRQWRFNDFMSRLKECDTPLPNDIILCNGYDTHTDRDSIDLTLYPHARNRSRVGINLIYSMIYSLIIDKNIPVAIMTEDDVNLRCGHTTWINTLMDEFVNSDYGIAYFGSREIPRLKQQISPNLYEVDFRYQHLGHPHGWCSGYGYFVKLHAVEDLSANLNPAGLVIDVYTSGRIAAGGVKGLSVAVNKLLKESDDLHDSEIR